MTETPSIDAVWRQRTNQRRSELRRMRLFATGLLLLMLALFVVSSALVETWPWLAYPRAFAEAAMVGACADWFAVVALFRHPLGIPIPHTAIVPHHKRRIGDSLGQFISNNFLAPTEVTARLRRVDAAGWAVRWLKEPGNAKLAADGLQRLLPPLLDLLGEDRIRSSIHQVIRDGIDSIAAAPLAARVLSVLVAHGYHDRGFDLIVDEAKAFLEVHRDGIRERVGKSGPRWLPGWVDGKVTDAFLAELRDTLDAARDAGHPWRDQYRAAVNRLTAALADDPAMLARCERIKADLLGNSVVEGYLDRLGHRIEGRLQAELTAKDGILSAGLEHALLALGGWLDTDTRIRAMINRWARQLVLNTVVPNRAEIGLFVSGVVARWETRTLVDKLELQVGKDLQYIRINGTLVGGLVGLIIFAVAGLFH